MRELFVYYRVVPSSAAAARAAVDEMQKALRVTHPALEARLLARSGSNDGSATWMETYALPASRAGVDGALQDDIEAAAREWLGLIDGERHVEAFVVET